MSTKEEAIEGIRILVAVAKADGTLAAEERSAIESALSGLDLGLTADALLAESVDFDGTLAKITSPEARQSTYESAVSLAYADGECAPAEQALLDKIRSTYQLPEKKGGAMDRWIGEAKDTMFLSNIQAISDPAKRAKEVREDILKYSLMSAAIGAVPIPLATDLAVVALQVKMIRDIGLYHGHKIGNDSAKTLLGSMAGSTIARLAVNSIVKVVPFWGSAVAAVTSFAASWGVGRVADQYFESGMKMDAETLKKAFAAAKTEAKTVYEANKNAFESKKSDTAEKLAALNAELKAGKITQEEYAKRAAELA